MNLNIDTALEAYSNVAPLRKSAEIIEIRTVAERKKIVDDELTLSERFARLSALVLMWERSKQSVDRLRAMSLANVNK